MTISLPFYQSPNIYSGRAGHAVQCIIVHSCECPMTAGLAKSLAGPNWFGSTKAGTSAHAIFDQTGGWEMVKPADTAWAVGAANQWTYSIEHCGYAAFSAGQWLTADGKKMLTASAAWARQIAAELGIPWKRLTQAEMQAGQKGLATHNDCRLVWGGTTHTDPQWADEVWDFYLAAGQPTTPTATTTTGDVLDMTPQELSDLIDQRLKVALGSDYGQISSRAAIKVRDMGNGTTDLKNHSLSQGVKLQAICDHLDIKVGQ